MGAAGISANPLGIRWQATRREQVVDESKLIRALRGKMGGRFSVSLGINLDQAESHEVFKWFLASILYGARISETIANNTYRMFERNGVLSPDRILETGWDGLVLILDMGGYVRYDFKTATKLLEVVAALKERFDGNLNVLHAQAQSSHDLEQKLMDLGKGIGPVTMNIFLRELRDVWEKADPLPQDLAVMASRNLGLIQADDRREILGELRAVWERNALPAWTFADFESSLVRLGKDYCRRGKCDTCPVVEECERSAITAKDPRKTPQFR
jgi:endonuclease III